VILRHEARSVFWRRREELANAMIERAITRGELPDNGIVAAGSKPK
jgi:hypothetical protein